MSKSIYRPLKLHKGRANADQQIERDSFHSWLSHHNPQGLDATVWNEAGRPFIREHIGRLDESTDTLILLARRLIMVIKWRVVRIGAKLDIEDILHPDVVDEFNRAVLQKQRSGATYLADLKRMGRALTRSAPWDPMPATYPRRMVARAYSAGEEKILVTDIQNQSTLHRIGLCRAVYVPCRSLGIDGRWLPNLRGTDIRREGCHVIATLMAPEPREVVALSEFSDELWALAQGVGNQFLIGGSGSKNRLSDIQSKYRCSDRHPRLSASRLRTTWLVDHVSRGTRLPELVQAAGLGTAGAITDVLSQVERLSLAEARHQLSGRR